MNKSYYEILKEAFDKDGRITIDFRFENSGYGFELIGGLKDRWKNRSNKDKEAPDISPYFKLIDEYSPSKDVDTFKLAFDAIVTVRLPMVDRG